MRNPLIILAGIVLTGCATQPSAMQQVNTALPMNVAAAALVFDAPITFGEPLVDITRSDRGAAAFYGFEDESTSAYDIVNFNRQTSDFSDRYIQEAITEKTGTLRR